MKSFSFLANALPLITSMLLVSSCAHVPWDSPRKMSDTPEMSVREIEALIKDDPESTKLRKDLYLMKEKVTQELMQMAKKAQSEGQLLEAQVYYERILAYDPSNSAAATAIDKLSLANKSMQRVEKANKLQQSGEMKLAKKLVHEALLETPNSQEAKALKSKIKEKTGVQSSEPPKLKAQSNKPVTLELRDADIKVVFEALSRATGINFILDKDIRKGTKASVFVRKMPIEDAINLVLSSNGLQKKNLSENTALIFPATTKKLKDYRDLMIRSFYLVNTPAKQAATMLKSVLKVKNLFIDERVNMLVIRDTPEVVRVAEKLIKANDIEVAEVVLDIEVLEVTRSRIQDLGVNFPNTLSVLPTGAVATLEELKNITSSEIGVTPTPSLSFQKTTNDVDLLSNPRIRVKNNEKAEIKVGEKVPVFTAIQTANVGTSDTVTYLDVGLLLNVEPRITLDDFVNIKVELEVSSLGEEVTSRNGTTAFRIGSRKASTVLRLKSGETQILAGLIQDEERQSTSRLPGIGDLPLLGRLFSNQDDRKVKTEVVLAITPRIVGNLRLPDAEVSEYWSGTETLITDKPSVIIPPSDSSRGSGSPSTRQRVRERIRQQQPPKLGNSNQSASDVIPGERPKPISQPNTSSSTNNTSANDAGSGDEAPNGNGSSSVNISPDNGSPIRF